jgi:hypothetical protein
MPASDRAPRPTAKPADDAKAGSNGPRPPVQPAQLPQDGQPEALRSPRLEAQREMLALVTTSGDLSSSRYEPRDLPSAITLARMIATSPLCPMALRGREADVLLVMMTGAEIGLTTMQSLRNLYVVEGRIGMSAALIRGRCQKHLDCDLFEVAEADATHAAVEVKKRGWSERRMVSWSIADAERAGLVKPDSLWQRWPQEMCVARATTRAASMYFPDITAGLFSEEELRDATLSGLAPAGPAGSSTLPSAPPAAGVRPGLAPGLVMQPSHSALDAFAAAGAAAAEQALAGQQELAPRAAMARKPPKRAEPAGRRAPKRAVAATPAAASRNGRPTR